MYLYIYKKPNQQLVYKLLKNPNIDNLKEGNLTRNCWLLISVQKLYRGRFINLSEYERKLNENRRKRYTKRGRLKWKHRKWFN